MWWPITAPLRGDAILFRRSWEQSDGGIVEARCCRFCLWRNRHISHVDYVKLLPASCMTRLNQWQLTITSMCGSGAVGNRDKKVSTWMQVPSHATTCENVFKSCKCSHLRHPHVHSQTMHVRKLTSRWKTTCGNACKDKLTIYMIKLMCIVN